LCRSRLGAVGGSAFLAGDSSCVEVCREPLQTPCSTGEIVFGRGRDDQQVPGQRHPYALRDLQCAHSSVRLFELGCDRRIELKLAVVIHAQIVPSGVSCRLPRGQLTAWTAVRATAEAKVPHLMYPGKHGSNVGS